MILTLISKGTEIIIDLSWFATKKIYNVVYNWMYPYPQSELDILNRIEEELRQIRDQNKAVIEMVAMNDTKIKNEF